MAKQETLKGDVIKLDLGCGQRKQPGFIGVDVVKTKDADVVFDLFTYPWTFLADNSVDEIYAAHFIEHLPDLIPFMNEVHRVLKKAEFDPKNPNVPTKGFARFIAPYHQNTRCWQDPTHKQAISEATFLYYNKSWREANGLDHYPINCDFDYFYSYNLNPSVQGRSQEWLNFAMRHYYNVADDIVVTMMKR
jgi:hypothetical protein